ALFAENLGPRLQDTLQRRPALRRARRWALWLRWCIHGHHSPSFLKSDITIAFLSMPKLELILGKDNYDFHRRCSGRVKVMSRDLTEKRVPRASEYRTILSGDIELGYRVSGSGSPVILVHG